MMQKEKSSLVDKDSFAEEKTEVLKHLLEAVSARVCVGVCACAVCVVLRGGMRACRRQTC
jgi:hypothetical protein